MFLNKLEKMKFAKILLIISAIAFVASRTVTKEEEEYMAETNALKIELGYKEFMELDAITQQNYKNTNWKVSIGVNGATAQGELSNTLLYSNFASGLPFRFKADPPANLAKNMLKYRDVWYFPWNTISSIGLAMGKNGRNKEGIIVNDFNLKNKNGDFSVTFTFTEAIWDTKAMLAFSEIINDWQTKKTNRKSEINTHFKKVQQAAIMAMDTQDQIQKVKDSDEKKKKDLEAKIELKRKTVQTLTNEVTEANQKFVKASQELVTVETKLESERSRRSKLIIEKTNLEENIKILKASVKADEVLAQLKKKMDDSLKLADYWLKGAVYHRVVSEGEKAELMKMILDDAKFDKTVNGYFSPQ